MKRLLIKVHLRDGGIEVFDGTVSVGGFRIQYHERMLLIQAGEDNETHYPIDTITKVQCVRYEA